MNFSIEEIELINNNIIIYNNLFSEPKIHTEDKYDNEYLTFFFELFTSYKKN